MKTVHNNDFIIALFIIKSDISCTFGHELLLDIFITLSILWSSFHNDNFFDSQYIKVKIKGGQKKDEGVKIKK